MSTQSYRLKKSHVLIGILVIAGAVIAFLIWQESRTERVEFRIGDQTLEIEAGN